MIEQKVLPEPAKPVVRDVIAAPDDNAIETIEDRVLVAQSLISPPLVETADESGVAVTKLETIDLNTILPSNDPIAVEASDPLPETSLPAIQPDLSVEASKLLFVTGNRVNLRAGPSTGQAVVTQLGLGDKAELLTNTADGWVQIRHVDSGRVGYMSADFLSPSEPR